MSAELKHQILLMGPIKGVFELCSSYFPRLGYTLVRSSAPSEMVFRKRTTYWTLKKDHITWTHPLAIYLDSLTETKTNGWFHFKNESIWAGEEWSDRSVDDVENMLSHVSNLATNKFGGPGDQPAQAVEKEKVVERQVVVKVKCRYCGALNDQTAQKCSACGASI